MVIASFVIDDKDEKFQLFGKTFLLTDISIDIAFGMLFFTLSNIKIDFITWKLR